MKNIKNIVIIILIAGNAFFIGAHAKRQDEAKAAKVIVENSREEAEMAAAQALRAQEAAMDQAQESRAVLDEANRQLLLLQKQLEDCNK